MKMKIIYTILFCISILAFTSCEEQGLMVNSNDVAYLRFGLDMTKDTTTVSFKVYNEGEDAIIPIEVFVGGKIQEDDLYFTVSVDKSRTTLPNELFVLPQDCKIRKGLLVDTVYVTLKNASILRDEAKLLALMVDEGDGVMQGDRYYSRALISVIDRLFKPDWWTVLDAANGSSNTVDLYYLGEYSERKYEMFLDELKKDDVVFNGKDKPMLRKYALKLKNTLKNMNAGKPEKDWVKDEKGLTISVPVAG